MKKRVILALLFLLSLSTLLCATIPNEINYQGYLREFGQPVTGSRNIYFRVYNLSAGGSPLWTSSTFSIAVSSGIFNKTISPDIDWRNGGEYWIEVTVGGNVYAPRQKIVPQVYSLHSKTAEDVSRMSGNICFSVGSTTSTRVSASGLEVTGNISVTGNLGVGTSSPQGLFQVGGGSLTVFSNGNIGIGVATPNQKVDVDGNIAVTSGNKIYFDGGSDTYMHHPSNNIIEVVPGGSVSMRFSEPTGSVECRNLYPMADNNYTLGSTSYYWQSLYYGSGGLNQKPCFKDLKKNITIEEIDNLYNSLPKTGTFNLLDDKDSDPLRKGFIIDDTSDNYGEYYYIEINEHKPTMSLNLLVAQMSLCIQDLNKRILELEKELTELKNK